MSGCIITPPKYHFVEGYLVRLISVIWYICQYGGILKQPRTGKNFRNIYCFFFCSFIIDVWRITVLCKKGHKPKKTLHKFIQFSWIYCLCQFLDQPKGRLQYLLQPTEPYFALIFILPIFLQQYTVSYFIDSQHRETVS